MKWVTVEEGFTDIQPRYKGDRIRDHIIPGTFPFRYWILAEVEEGEKANGWLFEQVKRCARCARAIKPQYRYCYRCNNYLQVKRRIAA